jgi:ATP-binding cassette, subfamily B, bacterial
MAFMRTLQTEKYDRSYSDRELLGRIAGYFRPHRRRMVGIALLLFLLSVVFAATPILTSRGVDRMAQGGGGTTLALLIGVVIALGALAWWVNWMQRQWTTMVIGDVVLQMRLDAFKAAMNHDLSFYDEFQSARIVSRITSDTDEFGRVAVLIMDVMSQMLLVVFLLLVLFSIEWRLTLLLLVVTPAAFVVSALFQRFARRITRKSQQAIAEVNVSIQEAVTGISVAKNFRRESGIYEEFSAINRMSYDTNVRRGMVLANMFPTLNFFSGLGSALLIYFGGLTVVEGLITAGAWFLFINSVGQFWFPMINLSSFWSQFQAGLSATERLFALVDAEPVVQQVDRQPAGEIRGDIRFENVTFQYSEREQVLQDFTLHIRPGESVALVGHTGAGKSSIAKLVTRYYEFQEGQLLIDGRDIRTLDLEDYRRHLGIVSQVPFLFEGTVADNIRYGEPGMSDAQVAEMARQVGGDWLESLPNGLQTDVGERGTRLSLGQRQLVVLARMLAQNPAIFILDEATASVDPFTEAEIQRALELVLRERTSILIAHRLSTVKAADRILVLQKGRIIEEGSHDVLMARGGHYAELYNTYFRHQSIEYIEQRQQESQLQAT